MAGEYFKNKHWTTSSTLRVLIAVPVATLLTFSLSAASFAHQNDSDDPAGSGWTLSVDGEVISNDLIKQLLPQGSSVNDDSSGTVEPYLIDNSAAWIACFGPTFNAEYPLVSYPNVPKAATTVDLECGPHDNKNFGWWHISSRHQGDWQTRLDAANAAAPNGGPVNTWDDLMALSTGITVTDPWWWTLEYSGKRCYTQNVAILDVDTGEPILVFWPTVVVSMTNNRIITSIPTTSQDCTRRAPWETS